MKPEQIHIDQIRTAFGKMQSKEDLLQLLNKAKPLVYGDKAVPFQLKQITWFSNPRLSGRRYTEFKIKKKSGTDRTIHAPVRGLKSIQKTLSFVLQCVFEPHKAAMGFVKDKSIVDNARLHAGSNYVYNIDLKDFFPTIDQARVWKCLQLSPFNLNKKSSGDPIYIKWDDFKKEHAVDEIQVKFLELPGKKLVLTPYGNFFIANDFDSTKEKFILYNGNHHTPKYYQPQGGTAWVVNQIPSKSRLDIANVIASLCCTGMDVERKNNEGEWEVVRRNVLPQGAPTSPVITNIVCQRLDFLLSGVAKRFGLKYSRYADDITFSSMHNVYQSGSEFLKELHRIIAEQGFHIKESKTRLQKDGHRQEVTGLLVNDKANVQKRYIKQIRMWLYYWERYGYERAYGFFLQQYQADKGHRKKGKPDMENVLRGKLDYLKMVKGGDCDLYVKLMNRFNQLTGKPELNPIINNEIDNSFQNFLTSIEQEKQLKIIETTLIPAKDNVITMPKLPVIHHPKELVALLSKFSENNNALKYSSHSWDYGQVEGKFENYFEFIKKLEEEGKPICYEIKTIKNQLGTKILAFLYSEKLSETHIDKNNKEQVYKWGEHGIKYGWKSKELVAWVKDNITRDPFEFPIPSRLKINDKEITTFKQIVEIFKKEIEVRKEDNQLKEIMIELKKKHLGIDFRVKYLNLEGKQFYTDVHYFKRALNKVFSAIGSRTMFPDVEISAMDNTNEKYTEVCILHKGSNCKDITSDTMMTEINDGDFNDIFSYLKDLCDWSVETSFEDGEYRINYLNSSDSVIAKEQILETQGFKHILRFYKT